MKEQHFIDRLFREKLYDFGPEHPEHLWSGIESKLNLMQETSSKNKWILFGFWGAVLSLALGSIWWYSTRTSSPASIPASQLPHTEAVAAEGAADVDVTTALSTPSSSQSTQKGEQNQQKNTPLHTTEKSQHLPRTSSHQANISGVVELGGSAITTTHLPQSGTRTTNDSARKETASSPVSQQSVSASNIDSPIQRTGDAHRAIRAIEQLPLFAPFVPAPVHTSNQLGATAFQKGPDDCMQMVDKPFRRQSIELLSGPIHVNRLFYSLDSSWQKDVVNRNQSEKVQNAYLIGMRYRWNLNRDVALKSGITFTQINEKMTYQDGFNVVVETNKDGDTVRITRDPRFKIEDNSYSFIDIPLTLSYSWKKEKFFFDFNSGINFNLYAFQRGTFYDVFNTDKPITTFEESQVYPYKHFAGVSLLMSGTIGFNMGYNTSLFVEPGVRYFTTALSAKNYPVKQKYVNYRMSVGVRYLLMNQ